MLEEAFGYCGRRRFVALAYGVEGGVMGDLVADAAKTVPADLYGQLLLHPAMKPHSDAFHIEVDPQHGSTGYRFPNRNCAKMIWRTGSIVVVAFC
jgi:hypothetical protein